VTQKDSAEKAVRDIRRKFSAEEKIRIVLEGLRGASLISRTTGLIRTGTETCWPFAGARATAIG
jgi:transposase-like protein